MIFRSRRAVWRDWRDFRKIIQVTWRMSSLFISSSCFGGEWTAGLVLHQEYPEQTGELPTRAPGQAWGLKKKNLLKIEIREHPGTVWDLSPGTQQRQSELSSAASSAQVFVPAVPKSRCFTSKLCRQPQAGNRGWFRAWWTQQRGDI